MKWFLLALLLIITVGGGATQAQVQSLRSDSPLWTYESERDAGLFPEHFTDAESFGCSIPLRLGLYRRIEMAEDFDESFVRIDNYGVFHCAVLYGEAFDRKDADVAFEDHAWLIVLDKIPRSDGSEDELLALQIGISAGSRYILLRRRSGNLSEPLDVLDWECPASAEHRRAQIGIWAQNSCITSSKTELRKIAHSAAQKPVLARLELLPPDDIVPLPVDPS